MQDKIKPPDDSDLLGISLLSNKEHSFDYYFGAFVWVYGKLKIVRRDDLITIIEWLIENHFILKTKHPTYPVLHPTYEGMHYDETITANKLKKLFERLNSQQVRKCYSEVEKGYRNRGTDTRTRAQIYSKIDVHKPHRENGIRYQQIDIYYHGVGIIRLATAEEMEEAFQKHIENNQKNQQKTA